MGRKGTDPKVIQPTQNMDIVHNKRPTQSTENKALNKKELCRQTQNKKTHYDKIRMDQQET